MGPDLIETFYKYFLDSDPRIAEYFADTDMNKQKVVLQKSLSYAINFAAGDLASRKKVSYIGDSHKKGRLGVLPELYPLWLKSLIDAVTQHDPQWNKELEGLWRKQLQPVIDFMVESYDMKTINKLLVSN